MNAHRLDTAAIGISGLCLAHCLALPVLASVLPVFSALAEVELVHKAMVAAAVPLAALALMQSRRGRDRFIFAALALMGISGLVAGAFVHALHDYEQALTVVGAIMLASAHAFRWQRHTSRQSGSFLFRDHF